MEHIVMQFHAEPSSTIFATASIACGSDALEAPVQDRAGTVRRKESACICSRFVEVTEINVNFANRCRHNDLALAGPSR